MSAEPLVYLVTGANRGLGLAFVKALLARPDCIIFAGSRNPNGAAELQALAKQYSTRLFNVSFTAADEGGNRAMTDEITKTAGRVDVVIANAALLDHYGPSLSCSPADMMKHYEVNAVGTLVLFQAIWPLLQQSKNPKFIPISSASGSVGEGPGYRIPTLAYSASKAATNFIARTIRMEHENLVCFPLSPGAVDTDLAGFFKTHGGTDKGYTYQNPDEVVVKCLDRIDEATRETDAFVRYDGTSHAW